MSRIGWGAHFLKYELWLGLTLGAAVVLWSELLGGSDDVDCFLKEHGEVLYAVVAPINAAMLGFILAAAAIIVTAAPAEKLTLLRESAHYNDLWVCFRSAMRFLGAGTIVSVGGLVVAGPAAGRFIFYLASALTALSILRIARCIWAVNWVIRVFAGPPLSRGPGQ